MGDDQAERHKRPILVWIISLFFLISAAWTWLSFYLVLSGVIPLQPAQEAYFKNLTAVDYTATTVIGLLNFIGAVALFMLRRVAVVLFAISLALSVILAALQAASKCWLEALGEPGLIGSLIGYAILVAVCVYAWHRSKKGVLR